MKKITKYLVFSFLMVASIIATASVTYASDVDVMYLIDDDTSTQYMLDDDDTFLLQEDGNEMTVTLNIDGVESSFNTSWLIIESILEFDLHAVDYDYIVTVSAGDEIEIGAYDRTINVYYDQQYDDSRFSYSGVEIDASPVLNGQTAFVTTVDDPITVAEITSYISAYDETDGSITHLITIDNDGYTGNGNILGNYEIEYSVTDSAGNTAYLTVTVFVKDVLAPETTDKTASVSYADTFNLSNYLSTQAKDMFADNYDSDEDLTIVIQNDDYTANKTIVGDHVVQFKATDTSGNVSYAELTISVYDDVKPVFSGPASITKATTETLTLSEIKAMLSANDVVDGSLTSSIQVVTDDFTGRGNIVGSYDIQFSVVDSAGNIAYHTVTINVVDDIPPVFYVKDGYFISVSSAVELAVQDIIDILEITGQITVDGSGGITVTTLTDEYTGNSNTAGIYAMSFNVKAVNGEESIYSVAIEVVDDNDDGLVIDDEDDSTLLDDIKQFFDNSKDFVVDNVYYVAGGIVVIILISAMLTTGKKKRYYR